MNQIQNENWVARLTSDDGRQGEALSELRSLLVRRLHRAFATNPAVNEAFIEDVVQDALIAILASLEEFQGKSQFTTWGTTIAVRIALAEMRRRRWQDVSLEQLLEKNSRLNANEQLSVNEFQKTELVEAMYRVIDQQLTEKQRIVLQAELQGMPQEEIGRRLGSNRNAIYKLTYDARKRLRAGMMEAGFSTEDLASLIGVSK